MRLRNQKVCDFGIKRYANSSSRMRHGFGKNDSWNNVRSASIAIKQNPRTVSSQSDKKSETSISFVLSCETAKFSHHPKCLAAKGLAAVVTSAIADQIVNARRSFVAVRRHQS